MKILITGVAGFIGFHTAKQFLSKKDFEVFGIDSMNAYYDVKLKKKRVFELKKISNKFKFYKINIINEKSLKKIFEQNNFDKVIHLAAQAGVRHSISHPKDYVENNLVGFFNILNLSQKFKIQHLLFASTSSVYGDLKKTFKENESCNEPIQFYAATKKSNEIMAYSYSALYKMQITGLRFFTVYGPWGRPDMALFIFTKNIIKKKPIQIFNYGKHYRDFTYVDDIVKAIYKLSKIKNKNKIPYENYNIGNGKTISLNKFIKEIEKNLNIKSIKKFSKIQIGDIPTTKSNLTKIKKKINYKAVTSYKTGIKKFIDWYKLYYK